MSSDTPTWIIDRWAQRMANECPLQQVVHAGITLRVCRRPLELPGKRVYGAWDPQLRRIELFGCDASRSDTQLVETLLHELWHVLADARRKTRHPRRRATSTYAADEAAARRFTQAWIRQLKRKTIRRCAGALRAQAVEGPPGAVVGQR